MNRIMPTIKTMVERLARWILARVHQRKSGS